jgi:hypothetical protein
LSSWVPAAPGMAAQGRGWLHSGGDGRTGPEMTGETGSAGNVTVLSRVGMGQVSVPFSRVLPSSFKGVARRPYGGGWHSVTELTLALSHSVVQR